VYLNQSIFSNTPNLDEVTFDIESNINEIPKYLFYESGLKKITLPKSVKKIGTRAFYETINLEQVMFEKDSELIEIENEAFLGSGLKEIIFPDKINRIGQQAFFNLRNLHEIFIPKNIQYIDYANFTSRSGNLTVYTELPKQQPGWNPYWNRYHRAETSDEYQTHEAITFPETRVVYNCNFKNMVIPLNEHLIKVAGVSFENRQNIIKNLHTGEQLILVREKNNSFDSNAIGVHTLYGEQIGYIPKDINHFFAMKMDDGTKYSAYISSIYGGYEGMNLGLTIKLIAK